MLRLLTIDAAVFLAGLPFFVLHETTGAVLDSLWGPEG